MLEFQVTKGQGLWRTDKNIVSADATDIQAHFTLTADFSGTITAWWRRSDRPGSTWTSTLSNGQCTIPAEALSATDRAVYGPHDHFVYVSISDTGRTTSEECEIRVQRSAFSTTATPGTGGSPTAYEELVEQFDELKEENQQFKTDMTQQQTEFESTVTENVDNIRYIVETETAPPIIEEASGAEITLEDSAYRQVRDLQLYGYSKQVQTTGAQLFNAEPRNGNGINIVVNDNGEMVLNGTATANTFLNYPASRYSGDIYASMNNDAANRNIIFRFTDETGAIIRDLVLASVNQTARYSFTSEVYTTTIRIASGTTLNNFKMKPMINRGSTPLPWQPYVAPSSALIALTDSLRGIPVTSGGNYTDDDGQQWIADYIYRRVTDGKWCLWRNCVEVTIDENTVIDKNVVNGNPRFNCSRTNNSTFYPGYIGDNYGLCNMLSPNYAVLGANDEDNVISCYRDGGVYFRIDKFSSVDTLKTWLTDNPIKYVYLLATPTVEELPENVQTELNGLYTYNLHTDMWNNDGAYMGLKYVADTKTWINNKIAGLSAAMLNQN